MSRHQSSPAPAPAPAPAVRIVEVGPRDGLQNIAATVATPVKIELIQRLVQTGLSTVETTSFVSPKWIPQLADSKEVLRAIEPLLDSNTVNLPVLVPNLRGFEGALQHKVKEVAVFVSASEGFSRKNTNCSVDEALARARDVAFRAKQNGMTVRGYVSCIFECPYDGQTPPESVLRVTRELLAMGCYEVSLGDTLGVGAPSDVQRLLSLLLQSIPPERLAGHFHDTYGQALANVMKAYEMGLRTFDSSVAGLGGCPYAKGAKGNLATEDVVYAFERLGVSTGVNLRDLAITGQWISDVLTLPNGSRAGAALAARFQEQPTQVPERKVEETPAPLPTASTWETSQKSDEFVLEYSGRNAKITMTRPEKGNMLTADMVRQLTVTIKSLSTRFPDVSRIVMTGEGRHFCAGVDPDCSAQSTTTATGLLGLFEAIGRAPQVTIALVNGPCAGAGVGLAFSCDIRLASSEATFALGGAGHAISAGELHGIGAVYALREPEAEALQRGLDEALRSMPACGAPAKKMGGWLEEKKKKVVWEEDRQRRVMMETFGEMLNSLESKHGVSQSAMGWMRSIGRIGIRG